MKPPLRFSLGFVIYVAIFAAMTPIVSAMEPFVLDNPIAAVVSMVISFVLLIAMFFAFGKRFFRWADKGRRS